MADHWHREWAAALDALEVTVADAEALLEGDHRLRDNAIVSAWTPPEGLGPLPLDLRPRADAILQRQIAAAKAITVAVATNRRQASLLPRIEAGDRGAPRPAYVDYAM